MHKRSNDKVIELSMDDVIELSSIYRSYALDNKASLKLSIGNSFITTHDSRKLPLGSYSCICKMVEASIRGIEVNPSFQVGVTREMYEYNRVALLSLNGILYVGHPVSGYVGGIRKGMPSFEDLFYVSCGNTEEILSDISINDIMCGANKAFEIISSVGMLPMYGLEMENDSPALTGYTCIPGDRAVGWLYPYKTGMPAVDVCIEKLVGLSDRMCSCFLEIELSAIYWFGDAHTHSQYKARVSYNKVRKEFTMLIY